MSEERLTQIQALLERFAAKRDVRKQALASKDVTMAALRSAIEELRQEHEQLGAQSDALPGLRAEALARLDQKQIEQIGDLTRALAIDRALTGEMLEQMLDLQTTVNRETRLAAIQGFVKQQRLEMTRAAKPLLAADSQLLLATMGEFVKLFNAGLQVRQIVSGIRRERQSLYEDGQAIDAITEADCEIPEAIERVIDAMAALGGGIQQLLTQPLPAYVRSTPPSAASFKN